MPTVAKTSSKLAKLGDISGFNVSSAAIPADPSDSAGSVPTFGAAFVDGEDHEYLVGETLTLTDPSVGTQSGEIVSYSGTAGSNRYNLDANTILQRLNSEQRLYPLSDYNGTRATYIPAFSLEYWTQQCGLYFTEVPGDVQFYQSQYGHFGAFAKDITLPVRTNRYEPATDGMTGGVDYREGRYWAGFGEGFPAEVNLPAPNYLPLRIPSAVGSSDRLVFGNDIWLLGNSRKAKVTYSFASSKGLPLYLRVNADSATGFVLQSSADGINWVTRATANVPTGKKYSVYATLSMGVTLPRFGLIVLNESGAVVHNLVTSGSTPPFRDTVQLRKIAYTSEMGGSGEEILYGNTFISNMKHEPMDRYPDTKDITLGYKGAEFMVGFNGNVWEHMKQYCSLYHLDVSYRDNKLTIEPRQRDVVVGATLSDLRTQVQDRDQARNVEVVIQNHEGTGVTNKVLWKADTVYQVAVGDVEEIIVQTPHSILETSQPVCVDGIWPFPYKEGAGQYVVTGSDGYIVSPQFWEDQGGKITTETTENEGEIKITIKGPDYDSPRAPYRISEGDAGRPALYVTGQGVLANPKTLKIATGKHRAAKDVGANFDSPFVSDEQAAYDAGLMIARTYAVPETSISISEPIMFDEVSKLGTFPAGKLVKHKGNVMRVVSASQTPTAFTGNAIQHNTIYQQKRSFGPGNTIAEQNAYYAGKTIGQVNKKPLKVVK